MKKLFFCLILFFVALLFCSLSIAAEPDWIYFDFSLAKDFQYVDRANISRPYPSYDIFRVLQKTVYKNRTVNITADRRKTDIYYPEELPPVKTVKIWLI